MPSITGAHGPIAMMKEKARYVRYLLKLSVADERIPASSSLEYCIKQRYRHRLKNNFYDIDAEGKSENWQREVYEAAAGYAKLHGSRVIFDVGCGSGVKLVQFFENFHTVGFDLEPNVSHLRLQFPSREWRSASFEDVINESPDVLICADVIEHVPDPDRLMDFLASLSFDRLFISTPERKLLYGFNHSGPPDNPAHCREWTMVEFANYVSQWLCIESHSISNVSQATQMIVARKK
jgi:2-polyprenyl-3-methyl-5-hydroxy-6-metoxy-1,4-benzoquinol methylase